MAKHDQRAAAATRDMVRKAFPPTEEDVIEWFATRSNGSIRRVIDAGEAIITERVNDGVFE